MEITRTMVTDYNINDLMPNNVLRQFYTQDMNTLLDTYEPGKPEHKPILMEQMKIMEDERNKRMDDHTKILLAQNKLMAIYSNSVTKSVTTNNNNNNNNNSKDIESLKQYYEKQLADKSYIINELLKKLKEYRQNIS